MIRYSGSVLENHRQQFVDDMVNKNIEFFQTIESDGLSFFTIYLRNSEDELVFKLSWPEFIKVGYDE